MNSNNLMRILDVNDVYTDGFLVDDSGSVAFLSLIGKDTAIQELRARWSLPLNQGGLTDFQIETAKSTVRINIGSVESLEFLSGRLATKLFGNLIQVFVYKQLAQKPDYANRKALQLFKKDDTTDITEKLWSLIKNLAPLPLLDQWKDIILMLFKSKSWLIELPGMGDVSAHILSIPEDELAEILKINIQCGALLATPSINGSYTEKDSLRLV